VLLGKFVVRLEFKPGDHQRDDEEANQQSDGNLPLPLECKVDQ
jgi:hypothetical protein